jgi:hypothetical protein
MVALGPSGPEGPLQESASCPSCRDCQIAESPCGAQIEAGSLTMMTGSASELGLGAAASDPKPVSTIPTTASDHPNRPTKQDSSGYGR